MTHHVITVFTLILSTITIVCSIGVIVILGKGIANIRRQRKHHDQEVQAHIDELIEDLDKTWAGT